MEYGQATAPLISLHSSSKHPNKCDSRNHDTSHEAFVQLYAPLSKSGPQNETPYWFFTAKHKDREYHWCRLRNTCCEPFTTLLFIVCTHEILRANRDSGEPYNPNFESVLVLFDPGSWRQL